MKKLLTILAASAMFFAFGDGIENGINFEAYTNVGEGSFNPLGDDPGTESQYWYSASSVGNVISNHVEAPVLPSGVTVPDMFVKDTSNTNFLYLETEAPLFRTVKTNGHDPDSFGDSGVLVTENPIYLDTLVKFTAADSAFTSFEDAADKIAIEYVEHEEESHEDPEGHTNIVDSVGFTNFVIRAGYVVAADNSATIVETNYYAAVPEGFNKDAWHRLTVRSIANIDGTGTGKGHVGFVVYLDQVPLKYATSVAVGNATFESNLNADVTKNFYNSETPIHALYPSAVDPEELTGQKISAVAFSGNGSVDDVVFTTTKPGFINESSIVTVTWDEHVATLTLNGNAVEGFVAGTAGNANVEPTNGVVLVAATFAAGWEAGKFTTDGDGSWDSATSSFVDLASGETCNIVSMFPYFEVNGQRFDKFDEALVVATGASAAQRGTVKVYASYTGDIEVKTGFVTIDLAGQTLTGKTDAAIINDGADLIITNSTVTIGHIATGTAAQAILLTGGLTTITAGWVDGEAFIDGGALTLTGGYYYDINGSTDVADFYLTLAGATIADTVSYVGDPEYYFQVGSNTPVPTTYEVTWTLTGGTTTATSGDDFAENDTIVFTADTGKTLSFVSIDGTEIADTSVYGASSYTYTVGTAAATLVVTFTAGGEEDWPTGTDLDDLEGKAVQDVYSGLSADFDKVDAKTFVTWASGVGGVAYADKGTTTFNIDCFLLNIANASTEQQIEAATATAAEAIKITSITIGADGKPVITTANDTYGNGVVVIEGSASLEPISWHEKTDSDHFFHAKLVVNEVVTPEP